MNKDKSFMEQLRELGIEVIDTKDKYYATNRYTQKAIYEDINKDTKETKLKYNYVLPVPNVSQVWQNEISEDLKQFGCTKAKDKSFVKQLRELGIEVIDTNDKYYTTNRYAKKAVFEDINKNTKRTKLKYKNKIGLSLKKEVKEMLMRRGEILLLIANAGGGKTYSVMQCTCELLEELKDRKIAYVLPVPNVGQAWQNEVSEDLKQFGYTKVVGTTGKRIKINAKKPLYSPVFDKTLETVEELKRQGYEVVLIIDECHKLVKDTYRHKALLELDIAKNIADLVVMMTATPRLNLSYYKYDEIFELEDIELKNNIETFRPIYTLNWSVTLLKEIKKAIKKGLIPLIRLNSKKEIEVFMKKLEDAGISSQMLTSETKDSEVFKSIQENGTVGTEAMVLFCTSVVECGISLKDTNIIPIEVIRKASDFDKDNTTQFFARPRKKVTQGIMIIKQYDEDLKVDKKSTLDVKSYEWHYAQVSKIANIQLNAINAQVEANLEMLGFNYAKRELEEMMEVYKNERNVLNVFEADYKNLTAYIDNKKLLQKVYSEMDKEILIKSPLKIRDTFKGSIFYDKINVEVDEVYTDINDFLKRGLEAKLSNNKEDKRLKEILKKRIIKKELSNIALDIYSENLDMNMINELQSHRLYSYIVENIKIFSEIEFLKDARREATKTKKLKEDDFRALLDDKNFVKAIPDIANEKITADNIEKYNLEISLHDIIDFRESSLFKSIWEASVVFNSKDAIMLAKYRYVNNKGEYKYLSRGQIKKICELKHFIEKTKKIKGLTKYDLIYNIVINKKIRTDKNGKNKLVQINQSNDLIVEIATELVKNKFYDSKELMKVIKELEVEKQLLENPEEYELYTKENIKKLDLAMSSQLKNRVIGDIADIFRVGEDSKGYQAINAPKKKFSLENYLSDNF